eukprot:358374-Chlamydomonas_euryale.AAC.9
MKLVQSLGGPPSSAFMPHGHYAGSACWAAGPTVQGRHWRRPLGVSVRGPTPRLSSCGYSARVHRTRASGRTQIGRDTHVRSSTSNHEEGAWDARQQTRRRRAPAAVDPFQSRRGAAMSTNEEKFFPSLVSGLRDLQAEGDAISTMTVVNLVERIIRVFDYLGTVLAFAKVDMHAKCESLRAAAATHPTLEGLVQADIQAGMVTTKNSCGRNLHRLTAVIKFLRLFLTQLLDSPNNTLKVTAGCPPVACRDEASAAPLDAAKKAYSDSLAPIHTFVVRNTVWAGLYMLPTRAAFLESIQEDEESARGAAEEFVNNSGSVEAKILALVLCKQYQKAMKPWLKATPRAC